MVQHDWQFPNENSVLFGSIGLIRKDPSAVPPSKTSSAHQIELFFGPSMLSNQASPSVGPNDPAIRQHWITEKVFASWPRQPRRTRQSRLLRRDCQSTLWFADGRTSNCQVRLASSQEPEISKYQNFLSAKLNNIFYLESNPGNCFRTVSKSPFWPASALKSVIAGETGISLWTIRSTMSTFHR